MTIDRTWKQGDVITLHFPMKTFAEVLPDKSHWVSFIHGPLVLAAATDTTDLKGLKADGSRWGHIANGKLEPMEDAPLLIMDSLSPAQMPLETDSNNMVFSVSNLVNQEKYKDLRLVPFFEIHDTRYVIYWPYASKEELPRLQQQLKEKEQLKQQLAAATVDVVYAGEQQPESDHHFKGEQTKTGFFKDRHYRTGTGWFSYALNNADLKARKFNFMYYGSDKERAFDVFANGQYVGTIEQQGTEGNDFRYRLFNLPQSVQASPSITILFKAKSNLPLGNIYEVRLLSE
jgi:hypothetical protein